MKKHSKKIFIDLIFNAQCPYLDEARGLIEQLKSEIAYPLIVREWDLSLVETPEKFKTYQSPTFIVGGKYINPDTEGPCRCHRPHRKLVSYNTLKNATLLAIRGKTPWYLALASLPTVLLSLIPFSGCPCSFVALTAFLSALGLSWVNEYIVPLFATFLFISLLCLYIMALKSDRYIFFIFGLISSAILSIGKWYEVDILSHMGIGGLVVVSLLAALYKKRIKRQLP